MEKEKTGNKIENILDDPKAMRAASQRAMRLAAKLNGTYHEPQEVRRLFFELIDQPEDDTFCLFPPFYTDCGMNITVGKTCTALPLCWEKMCGSVPTPPSCPG